MYEITPPKSVHAFDIEALRSPDITFWTAWDGEELLGCGALKELDSRSGEIKSMRTRFWKVQIAVLSISEKLKMKFLRNI